MSLFDKITYISHCFLLLKGLEIIYIVKNLKVTYHPK